MDPEDIIIIIKFQGIYECKFLVNRTLLIEEIAL